MILPASVFVDSSSVVPINSVVAVVELTKGIIVVGAAVDWLVVLLVLIESPSI